MNDILVSLYSCYVVVNLSCHLKLLMPLFFLGSRSQKASILEKLEEINKAQSQLEEKEKALNDAKKEYALLKRAAEE